MADIIDLPPATRILELVSPGFALAPPDLRYAARIPADILAAMAPAWNRGRFAESPVGIHLLEDAYVAEEGLVFDAAGRLFRQTITQHSAAEIERGHAAVRGAMAAGLAGVEAVALLCTKRGVRNYGHWLIEMLPKAALLRHHLPIPGLRYIVPAVDGPLARTIADSLGLLGIEKDHGWPLGPAPARVRQLIVVDGLSDHGGFMSPLVMNGLDAIAARVRGAAPQKLYVSRAGAPSRRFARESEVAGWAQAAGYTVIDPGALPFAAQVSLFKTATHVVGPMGAGLANIAFARPGTRVLNLAPAAMPDTFFWFIAGLRGLPYSEWRCEQTGPVAGPMPWDRALDLDLGDLYAIFQ